MMVSAVNVLITFRYGDGFILCLEARPLDITVSNQVNQHDVAGRHHLQRVGGGPLTTLPAREGLLVKQDGAQIRYDYRIRKNVFATNCSTTMKHKLNV